MNEYILIMNLSKEMQTIYEKSLKRDKYEIKKIEEGLIFAKKEINKEVNIENENKLIELVISIAKKYTDTGMIYINLSEEFNSALANEEFDINKDGRIRWKMRQEITKAIMNKNKS